MIGKIYSSLFPYFDRMTNKMSYKNRPVLIISDLKESYPELFLEIISKVEEFNKRVVEKSLENL